MHASELFTLMLYHEHVMTQMVINAMFRFEYVYNCFLQMHGIWLKIKSLYSTDSPDRLGEKVALPVLACFCYAELLTLHKENTGLSGVVLYPI